MRVSMWLVGVGCFLLSACVTTPEVAGESLPSTSVALSPSSVGELTTPVGDARVDFGPYASLSSWYAGVGYLASALVVDGEAVQLDTDGEVVVRFSEVTLSVEANGCNFGSSRFRIDEGILRAVNWEQAREGCETKRPELWEHLTQLFTTEPALRASGVRFHLSTGNLALELDPVLVRDPEVLRCRGDGSTIRPDVTVMYPTSDAAIEAAADQAGIADRAFTREARSNTWLAGSSGNPEAMIDLHQRDGRTDWFILAVRRCGDGPAEAPLLVGTSVVGATPLPFRLVVEDARTLVGPGHFETRLVETSESLVELWAELGLVGPSPEIDFESSVVLYFAAVHGSTCPLGSIQGVTYDPQSRLVYPEAPILRSEGNTCTADAIPHAILVTVDRADLPNGDFELSADPGQHR